MLDTEAEELRKAWGKKLCEHPHFSQEHVLMGKGKIDEWSYCTGDYVCTTCGQVFSPSEKQAIEANRKRMS